MKNSVLSSLSSRILISRAIHLCTLALGLSFSLSTFHISQSHAAPATSESKPVVPTDAKNVCPAKPGSTLPKLSLRSVSGEAFDLNASIAKKPTVLIFYRGGWCPYCNRQLAGLRTIEPELVKMGYQLLAISPDRPAELSKSVEKEKLNYTLLSDSSMQAARALGIAFRVDDPTITKYKEYGIDLEKASGQAHHLLPVPAVFVIGTNGEIHFTYVNPNYTIRLAPKVLLAAAEAALETPATEKR